MKKFLSSFVLCLLCLAAHAQGTPQIRMSISPSVLQPAGSKGLLVETGNQKGYYTIVSLDVNLENSIDLDCIQLSMKLPKGITIPDTDYYDGMPWYEFTGRVKGGRVTDDYNDDENCATLLAYSKETDPFTIAKGNGKVLTLNFQIDPSQIHGNAAIEFFDMTTGNTLTMGQARNFPDYVLPITVVSRLGDSDGNKVVELKDVAVSADMLLNKNPFTPEANVKYSDNVMTIGDITALIELLKK